MRLNKFIANNSQYSRRKADELIVDGKIKINGEIVEELGTQVNPEDDVEIDNMPIDPQKNYYIALNKPVGYVSTRSDELGRKTIMELLPDIPNLKPAGRLDMDSEGLIILSTDGEFINRLTHPKFECEKEYFVKLSDPLENIKEVEEGIIIEGKKTSPAKIRLISERNLYITIHEGRNRQIRKMFAKIGNPVRYLKRVRIANIHLGKLPSGKFKEIKRF